MFLKTQKGFTLIETLIAISILLIVIVGPMTIAQKGIQSSFYSSDQVTATFLAQEAMEAIREVRDNEALDALRKAENDEFDPEETWDWFASFENECDGGCSFDVTAITDHTEMFKACAAGAPDENEDGINDNCGRIYIDEGTGVDTGTSQYVTSNTGTPSPFTRTVLVEESPTQDGAKITVSVSWTSVAFGGNTRTVSLQTWVYDHYERYGIAP